MKTWPAQIVFTEDDRGNLWRGRLLHQQGCIDVESHGRWVDWTPFFDIRQGKDLRFYVTMQGGRSQAGRRYATYGTLRQAQQAGIRWAGRRFRIPENTFAFRTVGRA